MEAQIKLGRIFGVKIGLHYSWLIIALLKILAVIGVLAVATILGVWLGRALMMGGMWLAWIFGGSRSVMVGCSLAGILILAAIIVGLVLLLRTKKVSPSG